MIAGVLGKATLMDKLSRSVQTQHQGINTGLGIIYFKMTLKGWAEQMSETMLCAA